MNSDQLAIKWKRLKGAAKAPWGKLTDDDLAVFDGDQEKLQKKLQERYTEQIKRWSARMRDTERETDNVDISRRRAS
jgi:uncharacterized protein YjbJ (UPF0337 family)